MLQIVEQTTSKYKISFEKEHNNEISFLDILKKSMVKTFLLFFVKKTTIGLFTNYLSFTSLS